MKTVREVMSQDIVTVHPASTVKTAIILMKGHGVGCLPVVNGEALLGLVLWQDVLGVNEDIRVSEIMHRDFQSISPDVMVNKAADQMAAQNCTRLLVEEESSLVGILTASNLLPELGKAFDPLTGLPLGDALREWAQLALARGDEISLLFFDVDGFGTFNKKYGHVTGDAVLKSIAQALSDIVDPATDLLGRMGGDEFVICSLQSQGYVRGLGALAEERVGNIQIEEMSEKIGISYGVAGGRRGKEREPTHIAATVDDLLNTASKECTLMKESRRGGVAEKAESAPVEASRAPQTATPEPRLKIESIHYSSSGDDVEISVTLSREAQQFHQTLAGHTYRRNSMRLAADACAAAAEGAIQSGHRLAVEEVSEYRFSESESAIITTVLLSSGRDVTPYYGIAAVRRGDVYRAAVASVLSAINRPIAKLF